MPIRPGFLTRTWEKLRPMIIPCIILYCGYKGVASGFGDHNYAEGTYYLFVGYLVLVGLREAQREARAKYREALKSQAEPRA